MRVSEIKQAWQQGYNASLDDCGYCDCPYPQGSPLWEWWIDGYDAAFTGLPVPSHFAVTVSGVSAAGHSYVYVVSDSPHDRAIFRRAVRDEVEARRITRREATNLLRQIGV